MSEADAGPLDTLKAVAGLLGLVSAVGTIAGFLSVRAYLSGLGVPALAELTVDDYLQHGGRFFLVVSVHLLPLTVLLYGLYAAGLAVRARRRRAESRADRAWQAVGMLVAAAVGIMIELMLMGREPVFQSGSPPGSPASRGDFALLLLVEAAAVGGLLWLCALWRRLAPLQGQPGLARPLPLVCTVFVATQLLLLPSCFGRVAMMPAFYDEVVVRSAENREVARGLLVFSDSTSHFLWLGEQKVLQQVPRSETSLFFLSRRAL